MNTGLVRYYCICLFHNNKGETRTKEHGWRQNKDYVGGATS